MGERLRYLSVCSGIEAATQAWHPLGWQPVALSEIEAFPSAVLAHHYPHVPNWGDMTRFQEWPDADVDVLCGGTPCQSFSVAGLRQGLADPRGNLTLTFLSVARKYRPHYIVWENVPGVLSDKDDALGMFMSGLNELGYAIDCDILDAQYFGLAQRRRRVFFVCHSIAIGRQKKTPLFSNATGQFLSELLLSVLAEASDPSKLGAAISAWPARLTRRGLMPKMKCFGLPLETPPTKAGVSAFLQSLENDWAEALRQLPGALGRSELNCDLASAAPADDTADGALSAFRTDHQSSNIEKSWSDISDALCDLMSMSTTSTATRTTTTSEIYTCARLSLSIVQSIIRSTPSPQNYFDGDGSGLTALRAFTNYARQAASDLFGNLDGLCDWFGFIAEAEGAIRSLVGNLGDRANTGTLFPDAEGVRWYSAPCREAGQRPAPTISARPTGGGGLGTDFDLDGGLITLDAGFDVCGTLSDGAHNGGGLNGQDAYTGRILPVAHALRGEDFDASEDGTGRGTPLVAVAFAPQAGGKQTTLGFADDGAVQTLGANQTPAVAFDLAQITSAANRTRVAPELPASTLNAAGQMHVATPWAVRRLTPRECEALQGFPPDFTRIPYRGKPTELCPDGPRYKALGNSMAVNCMAWLGERIDEANGWCA